ncbi:hypothetical protein DIPPA_22676 [Diplonema papillatum]|nr:hypothetical protein DIPPA_22676 [Diplonema papillatum]
MSLRQACRIGCRGTVAVIAESRSSSGEWVVTCRGTGWLGGSVSANGDKALQGPLFHVVSCGHVAQPQLFRQLYGKAGEYLQDIRDEDVRVQVQVRGDRGEILFEALAQPRVYATEKVKDDVAVLHLAPRDSRALLRTQENAGMPSTILRVPNLPPPHPDAKVGFSSYAMLTHHEADLPITAMDLAHDYEKVMGDLARRRGDFLNLSSGTPFKLVPSRHTGVVVKATSKLLATDLYPGVIAANSGSPLVNAEGDVLGMLCRQGIPGDVGTVGEDEEFQLIQELQRELQFFVTAAKLRAFLGRVEADLASHP